MGLGGVSTYVTSAVSEHCDQVLFMKLKLDELSCVMLSSSFNHQHSTVVKSNLRSEHYNCVRKLCKIMFVIMLSVSCKPGKNSPSVAAHSARPINLPYLVVSKTSGCDRLW